MIRLVQTFGAHTGRVVETDAPFVRFGRMPDSDVVFDAQADLDASGRHAELRLEAGQYLLVDVGSRNGTLLNGKTVQRATLKVGDEIEFGTGGPRMRVEYIGGAAPSSAGRFQAPQVPQAPQAPQPGPQPGNPWDEPPGTARHGPTGAAPEPRPQPAFNAWQESAPENAWANTEPMQAPDMSGYGAQPPMAGQSSFDGAPADRKYGQKTVMMMIQAAVAEANVEAGRWSQRPSAFVKSVASQAASDSSNRLKLVLALVTVFLFASLLALGVLVVYVTHETVTPRDESKKLQTQLANLDEASSERRAIEDRLAQLNALLVAEHADALHLIKAQQGGAVYLLRDQGTGQPICNAFSVRPDLLATTARCLAAIEPVQARGGAVEAVPNDAQTAHLIVSKLWRHPGFEPATGAGPDIGFVQVQGVAAALARLTAIQDAQKVREGQVVLVAYFGESNSTRANWGAGVIGGLSTIQGGMGDPVEQQRMSASTILRAPGSPVWDTSGHVVGVLGGEPLSKGPSARASGRIWRSDLLSGLLIGMGR